jgi:hypothetical protein
MNQCDLILFNEMNQWLILEGYIIVGDNSVWIAKPCYNVFKETNDILVSSFNGILCSIMFVS